LSATSKPKKITLESASLHQQKALGHKEIIENHIITNVLTNAVKFSPEGSTITVKINELKDFVEIIISDAGMGIPPSLIPHLFDPLIATTRPGTAGEKGTGFGLPIVQKFMRLMHGRVEISSQQKTDSSKTHGTDVKLYFKRHARS
jgi:signal transduction histidine kinase